MRYKYESIYLHRTEDVVMGMSLTKRILAWVLILTLLAGNVPLVAFAEDSAKPAEVIEVPEETSAPVLVASSMAHRPVVLIFENGE